MYAKVGYNAVFELALALIVLDLLLRFSAIERKHARNWLPELAAEHGGPPAASKRSSTPLPPPLPPPPPPPPALSTAPSPPSPPPPPQTHFSPRSRPSLRTRLPPVLTLLTSRRLLAALSGTLAVASLFSGLEATLPLHTAAAFGWRSAGAGLVFVPLSATAFLGPAVGRACDRYGSTRLPTAGGFALLLPAFAALRYVTGPVATWGQQALLYALLALVGACFALTLNPLMAEIAYVVEARSARRHHDNHLGGGSGDSGGGGEPGGGDGAAASKWRIAAGSAEREGEGGREGILTAATDRETVGIPPDGGESGGGSGDGGNSLLPSSTDAVVRAEDSGGSEAAYAQAFALFSMAYSLGNAFGPLGAGLVRDAVGWAGMCWALGIFGGVSAVVAGLWTGH